MQTRQLGNSDMQITPLGFGAWAVGGGDWAYSWGPQDDADSVGAIQRAMDAGINWIDTAAVYGLGHSEEVVGRAVKGLSSKPYIFTKCSLVWDADGKITRTYKHIRSEVEQSLRRLQVEVIDLYQCHWPVDDSEMEDGWGVMADLKQEGKVRWIGVSNYNVAQMKRAHAIAPITSLQPPYSLINSEVEAEVLPFCEANHIGVINYSPMQSGLLTGTMSAERIAKLTEDDWRRKAPNFMEPRLTRNLHLAELLRQIASRYGRSAGEAAIAWTLRLSAVTGAIVGARSAKQVEGWLGAADFRLNEKELAQIQYFIDKNPMPS
jgi:aryl-alcohol dehydrogenase-like predicted oxidoreductase